MRAKAAAKQGADTIPDYILYDDKGDPAHFLSWCVTGDKLVALVEEPTIAANLAAEEETMYKLRAWGAPAWRGADGDDMPDHQEFVARLITVRLAQGEESCFIHVRVMLTTAGSARAG